MTKSLSKARRRISIVTGMVDCLTAFFHGRKSITRFLCPFDKLRKGLCGRVVCLAVVHKYVAETKSAADILYRSDYLICTCAASRRIA